MRKGLLIFAVITLALWFATSTKSVTESLRAAAESAK